MRILTYTTLYPNAIQTRHGIFVETRLRHLVAHKNVDITVVAPVPWFPSSAKIFGTYSKYANVPKNECRYGINIIHPRYPVIPKIGMTLAPLFLAISSYSSINQMIKNGHQFDLIDAHYFYPDGVAAAVLSRWFNIPLVVTARGTDLNYIPRYRFPRAMIQWASRRAKGIITVCHALKNVLIDLGIDEKSVTVLRNGVDLVLFHPPDDREILRRRLHVSAPSILSVGHLIERKGHDLIIRALSDLPGMNLYIAGDGPERNNLVNMAKSMGLDDRVIFLGALNQKQLMEYYGAVDCLVLASSREGWANVILESMACGTPVVATRVWGTPEVVSTPEAGVLVDRNSSAITEGIRKLMNNYPSRDATREYAEMFSWDETSDGQYRLFKGIIDQLMI